MKKIKDFIAYLKVLSYRNFAIYFPLAVAGLVLLITIFCNSGYMKLESGSFLEGVLVEATGFVFDIVLFGVILGLYSKHIEIKGYHNEIEFFRGWNHEEGMRRTVGNIKLLNEEGVSKINLSDCYLNGASLNKTYLTEANLSKTHLNGAKLGKANLRNTNLSKAELRGADLQESDLRGADLQEADLRGADLRDVKLGGANLKDAKLGGVKVLSSDWLEMLNKFNVKGYDELKNNYKVKIVDKRYIDGEIIYKYEIKKHRSLVSSSLLN